VLHWWTKEQILTFLLVPWSRIRGCTFRVRNMHLLVKHRDNFTFHLLHRIVVCIWEVSGLRRCYRTVYGIYNCKLSTDAFAKMYGMSWRSYESTLIKTERKVFNVCYKYYILSIDHETCLCHSLTGYFWLKKHKQWTWRINIWCFWL
jgi:hypothetical protein